MGYYEINDSFWSPEEVCLVKSEEKKVERTHVFRRLWLKIKNWLFILVVVFLVLLHQPVTLASTQPLPTKLQSITSGKDIVNQVALPDWSQISLSRMPPVEIGGSLGSQFNAQAGYDLSRVWEMGDTLDKILKLGDLQEAFSPQSFSIGQIADISGTKLSDVALSSFTLLGEQTLNQLVEAVPKLGKFKVKDIPPVAGLLDGLLSGRRKDDIELGKLLEQQPQLGGMKLNDIDLSSYSVTSIPNIDSTTLKSLHNWRSATVSEVPGLGQVPLAQMPTPIGTVGRAVTRIDGVWSKAEAKRTETISGSYQEGFAVACARECAHIELDDLENSGREVRGQFEGTESISGKYQQVNGGFGVLGSVNGGKEPTGRHPFGDGLKVVVWEPSETTDTIDTKIFFRFCNRGIPDLGCTPYFVGPVSFLTYSRDDVIFVGKLDPPGATSGVSTPTGASKGNQLVDQSQGNNNGDSSFRDRSNTPCTGDEVGGISLDLLSDSIASIESQGSGGHMAIGVHTCADGGSNCGRAIGRYQTMSYHPSMVKEVSQVAGGKAWLQKLNQGHKPTEAEIMQYYPPTAQERTFQNAMGKLIRRAKQQRDPRTGSKFSGDRVIERAAQMWFGGSGSKIDAGASDAHGTYSLYSYGVKARKYYNSRGGNPDCSFAQP